VAVITADCDTPIAVAELLSVVVVGNPRAQAGAALTASVTEMAIAIRASCRLTR
jgi:hypothetical protein